MSVLYLTGDAKEMLRLLPDNYVHCIVTSPPYFNLRAYEGGKDIVWDGDPNCQHEWGDYEQTFHSGTNAGEKQLTVRGAFHNMVKYTASFCSLCNAWRGQLGSEPNVNLYISHLVQIFREVRRVLRPDGQFWLNIGDSASASGGAYKPEHANPGLDNSVVRSGVGSRGATDGLKSLDTCLIPFRLVLALQRDGWYAHSDNIWSKVNPMPRSYNGWRWEKHRVKIGDRGRGTEAWRVGANPTPQQDHDANGDFKNSAVWQDCPGCPKCLPNDGLVLRKGSWSPTESHEYIFQLVKSTPYFADREAVKEPIAVSTVGRGKVSFGGEKGRNYVPEESDPNFRNGTEQWGREYDYSESNSDGKRNLRSVWEFPTQGFKGAHFAVFPPKLVEIVVKASTSEYGVCDKCGGQWARVIGKVSRVHSQWGGAGTKDAHNGINQPESFMRNGLPGCTTTSVETVGFRSTCTCNSGVSKPIILDPFGGSGTTSMVAERLNCDSIYIDSSAEYTEMARQRIAEDEQKRIDEFVKKAKNSAKNIRKIY